MKRETIGTPKLMMISQVMICLCKIACLKLKISEKVGYTTLIYMLYIYVIYLCVTLYILLSKCFLSISYRLGLANV